MAEPFFFAFTTDGPLILRSIPQSGDSRVILGVKQPIVIETNAPIDPKRFERAIRFRPNPDSIPAFQFNPVGAGSQVLIDVSLRPNTRYRLQIDNSLRTFDNQRFSNTPFTINFMTAGYDRVNRLDNPTLRTRSRAR